MLLTGTRRPLSALTSVTSANRSQTRTFNYLDYRCVFLVNCLDRFPKRSVRLASFTPVVEGCLIYILQTVLNDVGCGSACLTRPFVWPTAKYIIRATITFGDGRQSMSKSVQISIVVIGNCRSKVFYVVLVVVSWRDVAFSGISVTAYKLYIIKL